jgi:tetratricopeptide (TPR) repeat protein
MALRRTLAAAVAAIRVLSANPLSVADLRGVDALARVYDDILDARFDQAESDLDRACGPAPKEACDVLAATVTWWRILLDPQSRTLDAQFLDEADKAIKSTEAWTARAPKSAEAHFYAGAAAAVRVQWRVLRDQKVAAAREGKRIRQELDRAIALDPTLDDAHFGIGMYKYYADVAPAAAKVLRFLMLLPGGDRKEGLAEMQRARARGRLLQGEADYQLQIIYLWYEKRIGEAVDLLESLHDRYPGNPLFLSDLARVRDEYQHDLTGSLATWRELLAAARDQRVNEPALADVEARLGIASGMERLHESDRALEQLRAVINARPVRPYGALAAAYLAMGRSEDHLGHRDAAIAAYRLAMSTAPSPDPDDIRDAAEDAIDDAPDASDTEAYRLSLEGMRKLERSDADGAEADLARSVKLDPDDGVARYRHGRALEAMKSDAAALGEFEKAIAVASHMPPSIAASAHLEAARVSERLGHRDEAVRLYQAARTWFGGSAETRAAAARALARLRSR